MFVTFTVDEPGSRRFPWANTLLILLNIWITLKYGMSRDLPGVVARVGFVPARPEPLTAVTHLFLHGGWPILVGNMTFLYMFGKLAEDRLGKVRYLLAYLLCGVGAAFVYRHFHPASTVPLIGSSGAITGVAAIFFLSHPWSRMKWHFHFFGVPLFEVPSRTFFVLGLWAAVQSGMYFFPRYFQTRDTANIAWWWNAGGFATGVLLFLLLPNRGKKKAR